MNLKEGISIKLRREGHDPFIDYLKGICILFVVLNHCITSELANNTLFCLWGSSAVPIFLIIQVFHAFKKGINHVTINYKKMWQRIIWPFLLTEMFIISIYYLKQVIFGDTSSSPFFKTVLLWGGIGPGCYYPWIYIQFAFLIPIAANVFKIIKGLNLLIIFLTVSTIIEIICANMIPMRIYRLLFLRYLFLFYLGYILTFRGFIVNYYTTILAIGGMAATLLFFYTEIYIYPFTHHKISICNWICYLYIAFGFLWFLKWSHHYIKLCYPIERSLQWMGIHSYDIFLCQMVFFALLDLYRT